MVPKELSKCWGSLATLFSFFLAPPKKLNCCTAKESVSCSGGVQGGGEVAELVPEVHGSSFLEGLNTPEFLAPVPTVATMDFGLSFTF